MIANMMKPSDSDIDSVAFSDSDIPESSRYSVSEIPESSRTARPADDADLRHELHEYGAILAANMQEADMDWVVREAFEAPLPRSWTEHVDEEGRVYFFNQVTQESAWAHPMDGVYRELIILIQSFRAERPAAPPQPRLQAVKEHLEQAHRRSCEQLENWSGPYASETGQYFYNEGLDVSTWVNPVEDWEYELAVRQSVLHRCLLPDFADPMSADTNAGNGEQECLNLLPLELPLPREDESQVSARSFYSARESSRSGHSERSLREMREALYSPSRAHKQTGERTPGSQSKETMPVALASCREEEGEGETLLDSPESLKAPLFGIT